MRAKKVSGGKVRYGVVAGGWISQDAFMPGVHHTGNSVMTALVTGDPVKATDLAKKYDIEHSYTYEQFDQLLAADVVDALYIATPNWRHEEFAARALRAGIHVLLEKPMEIGEAACERIIAAQKETGAKLMIAYRLHFEPATVAAIEMVRAGKLGQIQYFGSTFAQPMSQENHRAKNGFEAGPVYDMGPYPINAVRNLFGDEPVEVRATGLRHPELGFTDFDDTVHVMLKFPGNRIADFIVSYSMPAIDEYRVAGTKGILQSNPAYMFGEGKALAHEIIIGEKKSSEDYKATDHFGGETKYFSDCILTDANPEPDGEEGLCDVRVIEAIRRALDTGAPQTLEPYHRKRRIDPDQEQRLSPVKAPKYINASKPTEG